MNILLGLLFLFYGIIASYFIANITGQIKNNRNIRLHHWELGFYLTLINLICLGFVELINLVSYNPILTDLFSYMIMLSLGIFISDFKDFIFNIKE